MRVCLIALLVGTGSLHARTHGPDYPVTLTAKMVRELAASPFVRPSPSSTRIPYVVNTTPGSKAGKYELPDPQIPPMPQFGLVITDFRVQTPKIRVVVLGGTHAREQSSSYMLEGFLRKLVDGSPEMQQVMRRFIFFVYPLVNPEGRYAYNLPGNPHRIERDAPSNLGEGAYDEDLNRIWDDPTGWTQIEAIQKVILADTQRKVDWYFDFHARSFTRKNLEARDPPEGAKEVWVPPRSAESPYLKFLVARDPEIKVVVKKTRKRPQTGNGWAMSTKGLNATWGFVPECARDEPIPFYLKLGETYAIALFDTLRAKHP